MKLTTNSEKYQDCRKTVLERKVTFMSKFFLKGGEGKMWSKYKTQHSRNLDNHTVFQGDLINPSKLSGKNSTEFKEHNSGTR